MGCWLFPAHREDATGSRWDEAEAAGRAWRNIDRRNAMNLWHTDCVLRVSRTFDSGLRARRDAAAARHRERHREIGPANAPHDRRWIFLVRSRVYRLTGKSVA